MPVSRFRYVCAGHGARRVRDEPAPAYPRRLRWVPLAPQRALAVSGHLSFQGSPAVDLCRPRVRVSMRSRVRAGRRESSANSRASEVAA